jgi:hypothetical protein
MCTVSGLIAGVACARLTYAENPSVPVSWDLLGAREDVCARAVPACGVRQCGVGARRESGQRHGCGETVPGAAGGRCPLVGSPSQRNTNVRTVCGWACGGLGDAVSSRSAGSDMRERLVWCGVLWLFQGCCSGVCLNSTGDAWRAGTLRKCS